MAAVKTKKRIFGFFAGLVLLLAAGGVFLSREVCGRWGSLPLLNRLIWICIGVLCVSLLLSPVFPAAAGRFCRFAAEVLFLSVLFDVLSPEFHGFWAGGALLEDISFPCFLLSVLVFAVPVLLFFCSVFSPARRSAKFMALIDEMSGPEFEQCCAGILRRNGFKEVQVIGSSGDQGVDIVAVKKRERYAIQCKCYASKLGNKPVQEVFAGKVHHGCDLAAVMTNQYFTAGAIELAESTGVLLWDRDWIYDRVSRRRREKKTEESAVLPPDEEPLETAEEPAAKAVEEWEKEAQEEYLQAIWNEELKWRSEQTHEDGSSSK